MHCRNNTKSRVMADYSVEIRAKTRIREGEEITNEYLKPESCTLLRRNVINTKWFFYCSCLRCRDPTELGEYDSCEVARRPFAACRLSLLESVVPREEMWRRGGVH